MKVYEITIKPLTGFATPLKGDTLFGQFCWQIAYDSGISSGRLDGLLSNYSEEPFAVFSTAYPTYLTGKDKYFAYRTPSIPLEWRLKEHVERKKMIDNRKDLKSQKWVSWPEKRRFSSFKDIEYLSDEGLSERLISSMSIESAREVRMNAGSPVALFIQSHNTIDRLTNRTGTGPFAPYTVEQAVYGLETELALFLGINEAVMKIEEAKEALKRIGETGFGKDASTGLGRFEVVGECDEVDLAGMGAAGANACYALGPCVPKHGEFKEAFFAPFTRYGRHGGHLARSGKPFKSPVIMADEGGVFLPVNKDAFKRPYIGSAISGISKADSKTVAQGYSLYIPVRVEV